MQKNAVEKVRKFVPKAMPEPAGNVVIGNIETQLTKRMDEMVTLELKAAWLSHPENLRKWREEADVNGPQHELYKLCINSFMKVSRANPKWQSGLVDQVVAWVKQIGTWVGGEKTVAIKHMSVRTFLGNAALEYDVEPLKGLFLDNLSYVVDSADSERNWVLFQRTDPKGSQRSRMSFANKETEVGIMASIQFDKMLLRKEAKRKHMLGKVQKPRRQLRKKGSDPDQVMHCPSDEEDKLLDDSDDGKTVGSSDNPVNDDGHSIDVVAPGPDGEGDWMSEDS